MKTLNVNYNVFFFVLFQNKEIIKIINKNKIKIKNDKILTESVFYRNKYRVLAERYLLIESDNKWIALFSR